MSAAQISDASEALGLFSEQGYLILRDFLEPEIIEGVRDEMQTIADEHIQKLADEK